MRNIPILHIIPSLVLAFALQAGPAGAQVPQAMTEDQRDYEQCMRLVHADPDQAFEFALAWADRGGQFPARHCQAAALFSLQEYGEAATRFEKLAKDMEGRAPASALADLLGHAGIAWQQAGEWDRANAAQTAALSLVPGKVEIRIDRAMTLAQTGHFWEAIDELNLALEAQPDNGIALVLRGSAYRQVDALDLALEDVNRALAIVPDDPDALLERGIVRRLQGNKDAARADWLEVIRLHDGRPAADMARRNLELLDVKQE